MIGNDGQRGMASLVASGAADDVARTCEYLPVALGLVEQRLERQRLEQHKTETQRLVELAPAKVNDAMSNPGGPLEGEDFGEVLRHELNNPLTGILGNAELLLAEIHRLDDGRLPPGGLQRLETIAALAVRMRETIRRISQEWGPNSGVVRKKPEA